MNKKQRKELALLISAVIFIGVSAILRWTYQVIGLLGSIGFNLSILGFRATGKGIISFLTHLDHMMKLEVK